MLIAIFVICVILGLIITAVILMSPNDDGLGLKGIQENILQMFFFNSIIITLVFVGTRFTLDEVFCCLY